MRNAARTGAGRGQRPQGHPSQERGGPQDACGSAWAAPGEQSLECSEGPAAGGVSAHSPGTQRRSSCPVPACVWPARLASGAWRFGICDNEAVEAPEADGGAWLPQQVQGCLRALEEAKGLVIKREVWLNYHLLELQ